MRQLLILLFLVFTSNTQAATFKQAQDIYEQLQVANHIQGPPLVLKQDDDVNADETEARIEVNTGFLKFAKNSSEVALTLGHELGHYVLHHHGSTIAHEYAADQIGAIFMEKAGYVKCLGAQEFKRFHSSVSCTNPGNNATHPCDELRIKALGCK